MRKTGIDFEKIDSDYREAKSLTKKIGGYAASYNASFVKALLAFMKLAVLKIVFEPARIYKEYEEFKEFKTKCRTDERKRFESLRRTGRI